MNNNKLIIKLIFTIFLSFASFTSFAQLNTTGGQYYFNKYIANPAFAGEDEGISLFLGIRKQMAGIPGSPQDYSINGQYRSGKVGLGFNYYSEKTGILRQSKALLTYAYHLNLNGYNQLHFGVSAGINYDKILKQDLIGNPNDPTLNQNDIDRTKLNGDFGMAFTNNELTVQASLPNLNSLFNNDQNQFAFTEQFMGAIAYKLNTNNVQIEPRIGVRTFRKVDNLYDFGARFGFLENKLNFMGMYHSSNAASFGLGTLTFNNKLGIQAIYTTETGQIKTNSNGNFELNLKYQIF